MNLIDTHAHIHFNSYKEDMDEVIRRSLEKGVRMITVGTQATTSKRGLEVAEKYDGVWAAVGLHPNHLHKQEFWDEEELPPEEQPNGKIKTRAEVFDPAYYLELAKHPKCVAIGEFGLDYYRLPEDADLDEVKRVQKQAVLDQIDVATEADLPVIIHCRDAHAEQQAMFKQAIEQGKLGKRGVIHCFTGTVEEAQVYIDMGFLVSFTGIITFPPRKGEPGISPLQQVVKDVPLESIMIETDAPYLAPPPHRGKRNEPWYVQFVAEKIAGLKGVSVEEVAKVTTANAEKLFGLK